MTAAETYEHKLAAALSAADEAHERAVALGRCRPRGDRGEGR